MAEKIKWEGDIVLTVNGCPVQKGHIRLYEGDVPVVLELTTGEKDDGPRL